MAKFRKGDRVIVDLTDIDNETKFTKSINGRYATIIDYWEMKEPELYTIKCWRWVLDITMECLKPATNEMKKKKWWKENT